MPFIERSGLFTSPSMLKKKQNIMKNEVMFLEYKLKIILLHLD